MTSGNLFGFGIKCSATNLCLKNLCLIGLCFLLYKHTL
nr:MAG TPA: hypothetical protein [Caudoviricetes sp.]